MLTHQTEPNHKRPEGLMATKTLSTGLLGVQTQNDAFPEVSVINGTPRVSSLAVAEHFQKRHTEVLRSIRSITPEVAPEFNERNFASVEYADEKGEMRPMYQLSRDGFTLLAMGFAGKKALAWKIRYIEAFNAMERALRGNEAKPKQHALESNVVLYGTPEYWAKELLNIHNDTIHRSQEFERWLAAANKRVGEITGPLFKQVSRELMQDTPVVCSDRAIDLLHAEQYNSLEAMRDNLHRFMSHIWRAHWFANTLSLKGRHR